MKLKALILALAVCGFTATFAYADDGGGKTKGDSQGKSGDAHGKKDHSDCKRLELQGTFVSGSGMSFVMNVVKANHGGDALEGKPATISIDAKTKVRWEGQGSLSGPNAGDRVNVQAASCAGATASAPATIVARKVDARAPKHEEAAAPAPAPAPAAPKP